jgi:hypothetical protein
MYTQTEMLHSLRQYVLIIAIINNYNEFFYESKAFLKTKVKLGGGGAHL